MAGHPQSSPRGFFSKNKIAVGAAEFTNDGTNVVLSTGIKISNASAGVLTANSTALTVPGGIKISNARVLTANSTGFVAGTVESVIPTTDEGAAFTIISNSTGVAAAINSTGTTWKYFNLTSVQPT